MAAPVGVAGVEVRPGQKKQFEVPVARLPTGHEVSLPVAVVHGKKPGPRIWLSAAIHGDEINGVEIIRRVLKELRAAKLAGVVIAVPIVNAFGFIIQSRYLPDRRDLNRSFPGSPRGSLAARIAHLFMREVVAQCDYGLDLHSGSNRRTNLPQVRGDLEDPEARRIALAFGAPAVLHARLRDGSLREAAKRRGVHVLVYEGGETMRFTPDAIETGVRGVLSVLGELGMWGVPPERPSSPPFEARRARWVRAGRGGIFRLETGLGQLVEKGQRVGVITDAFGRHGLRVRAPFDGMVIGHTTSPLVHRGDAMINIAAG